MILLKMVNLIEVVTTPVSLPYLSEFRLIRPQDGISVLPLPITRSKNRVLLVFLEVHYVSYVYKTFTYSPHSASGQSPRHYVRLSYGLLQKTIIRPIPYRGDHPGYFSKSQFSISYAITRVIKYIYF